MKLGDVKTGIAKNEGMFKAGARVRACARVRMRALAYACVSV